MILSNKCWRLEGFCQDVDGKKYKITVPAASIEMKTDYADGLGANTELIITPMYNMKEPAFTITEEEEPMAVIAKRGISCYLISIQFSLVNTHFEFKEKEPVSYAIVPEAIFNQIKVGDVIGGGRYFDNLSFVNDSIQIKGSSCYHPSIIILSKEKLTYEDLKERIDLNKSIYLEYFATKKENILPKIKGLEVTNTYDIITKEIVYLYSYTGGKIGANNICLSFSELLKTLTKIYSNINYDITIDTSKLNSASLYIDTTNASIKNVSISTTSTNPFFLKGEDIRNLTQIPKLHRTDIQRFEERVASQNFRVPYNNTIDADPAYYDVNTLAPYDNMALIKEGTAYYRVTYSKYQIKEKERMNIKNIFNRYNFGAIKSNQIAYSLKGIAFRNGGGEYLVYEPDGTATNVSDFVFEVPLFGMPVAANQLKVGDIIQHCDKNNFVIIKEIKKDSIIAILPNRNEIISIVPEKSIFGFNFYNKIICPFSMNSSASSDMPFGNLLPLMLMKEEGNEDNLPFIMMMMNGNSNIDFSMMLPFMLMKNKDIDPMILMLMMNQPQNPISNPFIHVDLSSKKEDK